MALEDVLQAAVVIPVYIGYFDFASDPIRAWTGPGVFAPTTTGDADLDGFTFTSAAQLLRVSDFTENDGLSESFSLTFSVADDELDPYAQLIANRASFLGRDAVIWRAFMNSDESAVLAYVDRVFAGVMVSADMQRITGGSGELTLKCDQDLQKANVAPTRWIDHQFFHPTDTASSFINDLARGPSTAAVKGSSIISPATTIPGWDYGNWGPG